MKTEGKNILPVKPAFINSKACITKDYLSAHPACCDKTVVFFMKLFPEGIATLGQVINILLVRSKGEELIWLMRTAKEEGWYKEFLPFIKKIANSLKWWKSSYDRWRLIHHAAYWGMEELVEELISLGVSAQVVTSEFKSVLHLALEDTPCNCVQKDRLKLTRMLLLAGADPRAKDESCGTPIIIAEVNGYKEVLALLREERFRKPVEERSAFGF